MPDESMNALRGYHRKRIATLLRQQQLKASLPHVISIANLNQPKESSIARFQQTPELIYMVLEYIPIQLLPRICLISKLWATLAIPFLWRNVRLSNINKAKAIEPFLGTHGYWIQSLDFRAYNFHDLDFQDTNVGCVRSSLYKLSLESFLPHLPRLKSIDIRSCNTNQHPLLILSPYSQLESIAFSQMSHHVLETTVDIFSSWPQLAQLRISTAGGRMVAQRPLETILLNSKSLHLETIELDNIIFWDYYTIHRLVDMNQNTLRNLSVTRCYYYLNGIERELSKSPLLESLQLRHCYPLELDEDEDVTELEALQSILEKHPRIKHLSLGEWTKLESSTMTLFSRACPSLVSLELVECDIGSEGVRQFLIHCPHLRKLRIDLLNSPNVMELFLGEPWKCQQLEEIWIEEIVYEPSRFSSIEERDIAIKAMWRQLASLIHLRALYMVFSLPHSDKVLHPKHQDKFLEKDRIKLDDGRERLQALKQLEQLCIVGYSKWQFSDVVWIARSFPWLERFWYDRTELEVPQWSWMRKEMSRVELIPWNKSVLTKYVSGRYS